MKVVLKYEWKSRDTKIIFSILAKKKIKIIKTSDYGEVTIYIKNYDDLNKLIAELNSETTYGVVVRKVEEHYNMHTRTVTTTDSKGKKHTRTETYWTWDYAGEEDKSCKTINFCGIDFDSSKIPFPGKDYIDTLSGGYHVRFKYYGVPAVNKGTIFTNLKDKTINNTKYYNNMDLDETFKYVTTHFPMWLFWVLWIMLTGAAVFGFCYLENRWLE